MPTPPPTGDREFRDDIVRIATLTVNTSVVEGLTFQNCRIVGPAVVVPLGHTAMFHCTWEGDLDAIFWLVDPEKRPFIVGAVGFLDCTFSRCTFSEIGMAGDESLRQALEGAASG